MNIDGVVGLARARGARLCAAFREFDTQRTGVINRTYLEALIHLSLARELNVAESQQLARFLDKVTDKCENVEYDTFVQWLYAPDSKLSELVLSRASPHKGGIPADPRPLSGRTLARIVRHKAGVRSERSRDSCRDGKVRGCSPADPRRGAMDPPRVESAWPSMGIAHLSAWAEKGVVSSPLAPRDPGPPQTKMQPRHNFPRARTRSSQGYRNRAWTPGKASTPATEAPSLESGGYPGSGGASPEELSFRTVTPLLPNLPDGSRPRGLSQGLKDRHFDISSLEAQRMEQKRQELIQENMRQQELQEYHYRCQKLEREHASTKADAWTVSPQASRESHPSQPSAEVVKVTEAHMAERSQRSSVDQRYEQQLQQELARQQQLELELRGDSAASISWLNLQKTHRLQEEEHFQQQHRDQVRAQQEQAELALQRRQQEAEALRQRQRFSQEVLRQQQRERPLMQDVSPALTVDRATSPRPLAPLSPVALQQLPARTAWGLEELPYGANPQEAEGPPSDEEVCGGKPEHVEFVTFQEFPPRPPEAPRRPLRRVLHEPRDLQVERQQAAPPFGDEDTAEHHAVEVWHHQLRARQAEMAEEEARHRKEEEQRREAEARHREEEQRRRDLAQAEKDAESQRMEEERREKAELQTASHGHCDQAGPSDSGAHWRAVRSYVADQVTVKEMAELELNPVDQRQKLQETAARFEHSAASEDTDESTMLHKACRSGDATATAAILALTSGAGQMSRDGQGLLPADLAILHGHPAAAAAALRGTPLGELNTLSLLLLPLLLPTGARAVPEQASLEAGLRAASATGREAAARLLLESRASVNAAQEDGATALLLACRPGHCDVLTALLAARADTNRVAASGRAPLHAAAETGRTEMVMLLLQSRANAEALTTKSASSPLALAARAGHLDCVQELLAARADPTGGQRVQAAQGSPAWPPLLAAAQHGRDDVVALLLDARASPSMTPSSPLHETARRGHARTARLLLSRGAELEARNDQGATALHLAAQQGRAEVVQLLLDRGASLGASTSAGAVALHAAVQLQHLEVARLLLDARADPEQAVASDGSGGGCRCLHLAAQQGFYDCIQLLVSARANPSAEMRGGFTPLALAARSGHAECCRLLLELSRAQGELKAVDAPTGTGWTPLLLAAKAGHVAAVRQLLDSGASVNLPSRRGRTPLMVAVEACQVEVAEVLLQFGAALSPTLPGGWTVLHLACHVPGNRTTIQQLLRARADANALTEEGWAPLHLAVQSRDESNVQTLLAAEPPPAALADVQVPLSPLHVAAEAGSVGIVMLLLRSKVVPVDAVAEHGITALHLAGGASQSEGPPGTPTDPSAAAAVAEVLLNHGATVDAAMEGGVTPLMVAARVGREAVVRVLLSSGADALRRLPSGWCSFLLAVRNGHAGIVKLLVRPELLEVKTSAGRTALQCAKKYGHSETAAVLQEAMVDVNVRPVD